MVAFRDVGNDDDDDDANEAGGSCDGVPTVMLCNATVIELARNVHPKATLYNMKIGSI